MAPNPPSDEKYLDLTNTATYVRQLLGLHGLEDWSFKWDHARQRAGSCKYRRKVITLSRHFVQVNSDDEIRDTILHEIAHALAGKEAGHGDEWKAVCCQIGANPVRCYDPEKVTMPEGKYVATCKCCGKVYRRHRKPKVSSTGFYYCRKCGHEDGRLIYTLDTGDK